MIIKYLSFLKFVKLKSISVGALLTTKFQFTSNSNLFESNPFESTRLFKKGI